MWIKILGCLNFVKFKQAKRKECCRVDLKFGHRIGATKQAWRHLKSNSKIQSHVLQDFAKSNVYQVKMSCLKEVIEALIR
jgi:hypothetical protein